MESTQGVTRETRMIGLARAPGNLAGGYTALGYVRDDGVNIMIWL